jgi:hypothetical protein
MSAMIAAYPGRKLLLRAVENGGGGRPKMVALVR